MLFKYLDFECFDPLIVEFYITTVLLFLLLLCTFMVIMSETSKIINNSILSPLILYSLIFAVLQNYFLSQQSIVVLNGILVQDGFTKFIHLFILISLFIYFIIQQTTVLDKKYFYFENNIIILISIIGMLFLCSTYNLIILYLAIELQSLSFYILTGSKKNSPVSSEASLKYFILGTIGSSFILYGISIIYCITGSLNLGNIFLILSHINLLDYLSFLMPFLYSFLFITIGLLFKIGAAPFHTWVPDVYEGAPHHITMFFSLLPKIALISLFIRIFFDINEYIFEFFSNIFYFCSLFSIYIGSFVALQQKKIKRLIAYSTISHTGFILIGFAVGTYESIEFILFYLIIYIIMGLNFWSIFLSLKSKKKNFKYLSSFIGISKFNPFLSFIIVINLFSLSGIPPLAGFFSKFFIFSLAIKNLFFGLAINAILLSIISTFYYIRFIKICFFDKKNQFDFINNLQKTESIIIILTSQLLCFYVFFPDYLLIYLKNMVLLFLL